MATEVGGAFFQLVHNISQVIDLIDSRKFVNQFHTLVKPLFGMSSKANVIYTITKAALRMSGILIVTAFDSMPDSHYG